MCPSNYNRSETIERDICEKIVIFLYSGYLLHLTTFLRSTIFRFRRVFSIQSSIICYSFSNSHELRGCKNGTDLLYYHAKYGGDRGSRAGCRTETVMFLFVTLWNDEVCDNGNAMKRCTFSKQLWFVVRFLLPTGFTITGLDRTYYAHHFIFSFTF